MAIRMLCATRNLANAFRNLTLSTGIAKNVVQNDLLKVPLSTIDSVRSISFLSKCKFRNEKKSKPNQTFRRQRFRFDIEMRALVYLCFPIGVISVPGDLIWKGVTSVSNAGKKRGRGRQAGKGLTKDLNRGQFIGDGRKRVILPGLNAPVFSGSQIVHPERGEDNPNWYAVHATTPKCFFFYFCISFAHSGALFQGEGFVRNP